MIELKIKFPNRISNHILKFIAKKKINKNEHNVGIF